MARLLRSQPPQPKVIEPPAIVNPPFISPPVSVNLASGLYANQRRPQLRCVNQGWRSEASAVRSEVTSNYFALAGAGSVFGTVTTNVERAAPLVVPVSGLLSQVEVAIQKNGTLADNVVCEIQSDSSGAPSGVVLASASVVGSSLANSLASVVFSFPAIAVTQGTTYWVVLSRSGSPNDTNFYVWGSTSTLSSASQTFSSGAWAAANVRLSLRATTVIGSGGPVALSRFIGPRPPMFLGVAPVVSTLGVNLATGVLTNQRRAQQRRTTTSDLRAPVVVGAPAPPTEFIASPVSVNLANGLTVNQRRAQQRRTQGRVNGPVLVFSPWVITPNAPSPSPFASLYRRSRLARRVIARLAGPVVVQPAVATPIKTTVAVTLAPRRAPRRAFSVLPPTIVSAATFIAPPVSVNCLQPDRLAHRLRRMPSQVSLNPPTALQLFFGPLVKLQAVQRVQAGYQRRGPLPISRLAPPATLEPWSVALRERTPLVELVRIRPRHTLGVVVPPATLEPFSVELAEQTVRVELVHTRPRRTRAVLQPPTVVRVPAVEQNEQTIRVTLVSLRAAQRRRTTHSLTAVTYPATSEIVTVLTRTRPRPTSTSLTAVSYPATSDIAVTIVRTRPRPTTTILAGPVVLRTFAAGVPALTTTRPRPTDRFLAPPATLEPESIQLAEETVRVTLARIRPRHTEAVLAEPTVVRVPSVEQREQTISVTLVRARPRHTTTSIGKGLVQSFPPVVTTIAVSATLVRNRPRHTIHALTPPTVVRVPSVEQQEDTIRVAVVRVRPRPTRKPLLEQPTVLQVFTAPVAPFVRTRPRPTRSHLTYVVYPATSEIAVTVVHTRPRPTSRFLSEPTTLQTFSGPTVTVVQTRPRPTTAYVAPPATLEPESVQLAEETIRVHLAPSRRGRPTTRLTYVTYPATSEITVAVVRTRPRPTVHSLTAVSYPATSEILVALTRTRPRPTTASLTAVSYPASSDITVTLTRTRPRPTTRLLGEPTVLQVFAAGRPALAQTRPRPTTTLLSPPTVVRVPSVEQQEDTIRVTVVHTRPRPTHVFLREPLVKTFPPVVTTLTILTVAVRRPLEQRRHVVEHFLRAPQVVIPLPTLRMQTITVATVRTRPRPTLTLLQPPARLQVFAAAKTPLVHTRPRPTTRFLGEPTVVRIPAVDQRLRTIRVELVRVRPRHTVAFVAPPATLEPESVQLAEREIRVELVRTRPRRTAADVFAPTVLQTFAGPTVHLTPARHPVTASQILPLPPTRPERVTVETDLRVNLVARRIDAKTHATVFPPTVLEPTVTEITVALVQARPRPTVSTLTFVAPRAAVETKIRVALTRIRPRPTEVAVTTPAATARQPVATTIRVELVRTRPKATTATLQPPTRLRPPETTVRTHLVRRPTPAVQATLSSPTAVSVFTAEVDVTVTRTRPRATTAFLSPPTVVTPIRPPEVTDITVVLVALEQRLLHRPVRHFKITAAVVRRHGRAGRSEGSTVPASASEGGSIGSTGSEGGTQPSGASSGESSAQHRATIRDVPSARSEGEDRS